MRANRTSYDVAVVGAGPVGCVTAVAFARRGAKVALLESDPRAARRFAGEWLHPTAVEVLDELRIGRIEPARPRTGYGFVIFPDDRSGPIELEYESGIALSAEHGNIVEALRAAVQSIDDIDLITNAKVSGIDGPIVRCEDRETATAFDIVAERIVGADGRGSMVRQSIRAPENSSLLSYMAALELKNVELPCEGFGHVVLGGPGPALFYRISEDTVRACLDVPVSVGARGRTASFLWDSFHGVLPRQMHQSFRDALERGPSAWAANRFRPRSVYGEGRIALVGDAIGHVHPMTAIGMTMGFLDARALAKSSSLEDYERRRRGYIPELLSNALYHCFRREDSSATEIRRAMFKTLRQSRVERSRTMSILSAREGLALQFGSSFLKIAARAIASSMRATQKDGDWTKLPGALSAYGEWMQWPAAIAVPSSMVRRYRGESTTSHPIPALSKLVRPTDPLVAPSDDARAIEVSTAEAIEQGCRFLLTELEDIARVMGTVPDNAIAAPAMRSMLAITSTAMRPAMAARMTIGRRRLALEGFPRLLELNEIFSEQVAELILVLLDGQEWGDEPIVQLAEGVRALLECQTPAGGFASVFKGRVPQGHGGDLESTASAVRALDAVMRRRRTVSDADLEGAMARAGQWLRARQCVDGSWPAIARFEGTTPDSISRTALGLEALMSIGGNQGEPAVRRAVKWLTTHEGWAEGDRIASSRAVRACCAARATSHPSVLMAVRALSADLLRLVAEASPEQAWPEASALLEALGAYENRKAERPGLSRKKPAETASPEDWAFCKQALSEVSRTFSKPIALLPPKLEVAVTLGYLLCRIADTVEDHPAVPTDKRDALFRLFLEVLEQGADATPFERAFQAIPGDDAELSLARQTHIVMRLFAAQSEATRRTCIRWVGEMARGMCLYSHREAGDDGFIALHTVSDLERYCYYVAGTVGHLLTDLFLEELGSRATPQLELALREDAEGFACGLQLVNILKDVTDDRQRSWSFVPRTVATRSGTSIGNLCDPMLRAQAHAAVEPLFDVARRNLDIALRYALTIPADQVGIRLFCLLPLWMAARTLVVARGNDAMFEEGEPVKISRDEVEMIIGECMRYASDDDALELRYRRLYDPDRSRGVTLSIESAS